MENVEAAEARAFTVRPMGPWSNFIKLKCGRRRRMVINMLGDRSGMLG